MKKRLGIGFLLAFSLSMAQAQRVVFVPESTVPMGNTLRDFDLIGKVKQVEIQHFTGNDTANLQLAYREMQTYDPQGNVLRTESTVLTYWTEETGSSLPQEQVTIYDYLYNAQSQLTQSKDSDKNRVLYKYNKNGFVSEMQRQSASKELSGKTLFTYDDKNRLIAEAHYNHKNKLTFKGEYAYNPQGQVDRIVSYNCLTPENCLSVSDALYEYDAQGNLAREQFSGVLNYTFNYEYDAQNRLIRRNSSYEDADMAGVEDIVYRYDEQGRLVSAISQQQSDLQQLATFYRHDAQGNWTEQMDVMDGAEPRLAVTRRTIIYY